MSASWKAIVGIILIFIFGVLSGILGTSIFVHHKMRTMLYRPALILMKTVEKRLTGNLALDANQKQQIDGYFMENLNNREELQAQIQPQVHLLNLKMLQEISATLRAPQLERFRQNLDELRKRMAANRLNSAESLPALPVRAATNSSADTPPGP